VVAFASLATPAGSLQGLRIFPAFLRVVERDRQTRPKKVDTLSSRFDLPEEYLHVASLKACASVFSSSSGDGTVNANV
jgi:hypothetical protein